MNMKKSLLALAAVGVMSFGSVADAAGVGLVNINALYAAYPEIGVIEMQINKIKANYEPKIQAELQKIEKMKDQAAQKAAYEKNVMPLQQKGSEEVNKILAPVDEKILNAIEQVRAQEQLDIIVSSPNAVVTIAPNYANKDITPAVAKIVQGK